MMNPTTQSDTKYVDSLTLDATQLPESTESYQGKPTPEAPPIFPEVKMNANQQHSGKFRLESEETDTTHPLNFKERTLAPHFEETRKRSSENHPTTLLRVIDQTEQKHLDKLLSKLTNLRDLVVTGSTAVRLLTGSTDLVNNDVDFLAPSNRQPDLDEKFRNYALLFDLTYSDRKFYSRGRPVVDITYLKVMPRDPVTVSGIVVHNPQQLLEQYKSYNRPEDEEKIVLLQQLRVDKSHTRTRFPPKLILSDHVCKKLKF